MEQIFSNIPMLTWRWLGVNDMKVDEKLLASPSERSYSVDDDEELVLEFTKSSYEKLSFDVKDGKRLKLVLVQTVPTTEDHLSHVEITLGEKSHADVVAVEVGAKKTTSEVKVILAGAKSSADVDVLYFGDEARTLDLNYIMEQSGRETNANLNVYGALIGESKKTFRGTLDFKQGAKGAIGHEKENVIVLSKAVKNKSVPLMLSGEDDVDGHHAVSIGKIDEDKLYYLMSRGLDLAEARMLVVEASFNPVLDLLPTLELKAMVHSYISERLTNV